MSDTKLACGPLIELVGGSYCGMIFDPMTGDWTNVCTTSPIDQQRAKPARIVPVTAFILEAQGSRGTFRYQRMNPKSDKWMVLRSG